MYETINYGCNDDKLILLDELFVELESRYGVDFAEKTISAIPEEHLFGDYDYLDDVAFASIQHLIPNYFE